jgi:hypothetical protein
MKYDKLPMEALKGFKKVMPESKVTAEYKQKISELGENEIGHFTLSKGDVKAGTIKMRLMRAAGSLGITIEVKRFGDDVVFYKTKEQKTKTGRK